MNLWKAGSETRYLSFDGGQKLLVSAHKVNMVELRYISARVERVATVAHNWNFSESVLMVNENLRCYFSENKVELLVCCHIGRFEEASVSEELE